MLACTLWNQSTHIYCLPWRFPSFLSRIIWVISSPSSRWVFIKRDALIRKDLSKLLDSLVKKLLHSAMIPFVKSLNRHSSFIRIYSLKSWTSYDTFIFHITSPIFSRPFLHQRTFDSLIPSLLREIWSWNNLSLWHLWMAIDDLSEFWILNVRFFVRWYGICHL